MVLFSLIVIFEGWVCGGVVYSVGGCKLNGQNNIPSFRTVLELEKEE